MKRLLLGLALSFGLFGSAGRVDAQAPLRTLCMSPTMGYCMSILTWEYEFLLRAVTEDRDPKVYIYNVDASSTIDVFGPGWAANPRRLELWANASGVGGSKLSADLMFRVGSDIISSPGTYEWGSEEGPFGPLEPQTSPADVYENPLFMRLGGSGDPQPVESCSIRRIPASSAPFPACYEVSVPEPSTYLLMLAGVLGLGFVVWRRKEDLAA